MKRIYYFTLTVCIVLIFLGWMLNCTGLNNREFANRISPNTYTEVQSTDWIVVSDWTTTNILGLPARSYEFQNPLLSAESLSNSQLYVYAREGNAFQPLPYTHTTDSNKLRLDYTTAQSNTLRIVSICLEGALTPAKPQSFRLVLIPNTLAQKISVNMADYNEVSASFNLSE